MGSLHSKKKLMRELGKPSGARVELAGALQYGASFDRGAKTPSKSPCFEASRNVPPAKSIPNDAEGSASHPLSFNPLVTERVEVIHAPSELQAGQQRGHGRIVPVLGCGTDANPPKRDATSRGLTFGQRLALFNGSPHGSRHQSGFPTSPRALAVDVN